MSGRIKGLTSLLTSITTLNGVLGTFSMPNTCAVSSDIGISTYCWRILRHSLKV